MTKFNSHFNRRRLILVLLLLTVILIRLIPGGGDLYMHYLYPIVAVPVSTISGWIPLCISDIFYIVGILFLIVYPLVSIIKKYKPKGQVFAMELEMIVWLYVWFYIGWGLNYSASNFFARTNTPRAEYNVKDLKKFAWDYLDTLNRYYYPIDTVNEELVKSEIVKAYEQMPENMGIHKPFSDHPKAKTMLLTPLYSSVGVLGSMGPFFNEFTLNDDLLPVEYACCYAHEYAHSLGIAREGEASFYAYLACDLTDNRLIRFSGYFSILGHVLNALDQEDPQLCEQFIRKLRPGVKHLYAYRRNYWKNLYSKPLGELQSAMYESYLRSNNISDGQHNYSQVIGLLISYKKANKQS